MDRDELIARLREQADDLEPSVEHFPEPACAETYALIETVRALLAALESRPGPTEELAVEILAEELFRDFHGHELRWSGLHDDARAAWIGMAGAQHVVARRAMLRFATDTTPSRDEEGSVDREAIARIVHENGPVIIDFMGEELAWCAVEGGNWTALKTSTPEAQPSRIREAGERMAHRMGGKFILHDAETQTVEGGGRDGPVAVLRFAKGQPGNENEMPKVISCNWLPDGEYSVFLAKPTTPERSMVLEEAARIAESEPRVWDPDAPDPQTRIAAKIRALSASPIEVEE